MEIAQREPVHFNDRVDAGRMLAASLAEHRAGDDAIVLALPRGGVPVAYEVATALRLPLDVFVVRKLGVPGHEELAMGAIASGGIRVVDERLTAELGIDADTVAAVTAEEQRRLEAGERSYRGGRPPAELADRLVILVDDGLATGSSMRAAVRAVRSRSPRRVIVAVPVAPRQTCASLRDEADEVVCPLTPDPFVAVGAWFEDFSQVPDESVRELIDHAREVLGAPSPARGPWAG